MAKKIITVVGMCTEKNKPVGFQFVDDGVTVKAGGSFTVVPGGASSEGAEIRGDFRITQSYKCKLCGNTHIYQCCGCNKFICYDGREHRGAKCPACGNVADVPAAVPERIMRSGYAVKKKRIVLAMDVSYSMNGRRLEETKHAAINEFIRRFTGSEMALVTFGNEVSEVKTNVPLTSKLSDVERMVSLLYAQGNTPSPMGHILSNFSSFLSDSSADRYVVVFTDGDFNDNNEAIRDAARIKAYGVKVIAIGCTGANTAVLSQLASPGASITTSDGNISAGFAEAVRQIQQ